MNSEVVNLDSGRMQRWPMALYLAGLLLGLAACGGGGGDATPGVLPGPPPPGTSPPPAPAIPSTALSVSALSADSVVTSQLLSVTLASPPTVTFSLEVDGFQTVSDLGSANVRFSLARLTPTDEPGVTAWQSLISTSEDPVCRSQADVDSATNACTTFTTTTDPASIPDSALKVSDPTATGRVPAVQATTERNGTLTRNDDGTWRYVFEADPGSAADLDGIHRICIQFSLPAPVGNPCIDFVPAEVIAAADDGAGTSLETDFHARHDSLQVVATESCNSCHEALALHGGGRREIDYCVSCHNPGTVDANSGNSMDFKVLIHRLHRGRDLPSVVAGTPYKVWGFRNAEHDYSHVRFPQRVANCTRCHAGVEDVEAALAQGAPAPRAVVTPDGYNWATRPSASACVACHDNPEHIAAVPADCRQCHTDGGIAGSVQDAHRDLVRAAARDFRFDIVAVTDTAPGQQPVIDFRVVNPNAGEQAWDLGSDTPFTNSGTRISAQLAWPTSDFTNIRSGAANASSVATNALTATSLGEGLYRVTASEPLPDGTSAPFVAARGSGAVVMEGRVALDVDPGAAGNETLPLTNAVRYFSIDEPDGQPRPRRQVVDLQQCLACHEVLSLHGSNRTDSIESCVTCHNPRNTDRSVRAVALSPPTDGKDEESLDFKTMIHGIHAAGVREEPLQLVGFRGFTTHVYDEEEVQYPGRLANCTACHTGTSYALPLAANVLATTTATGDDVASSADDAVVTPATAVCASCHDDAVAAAHMTANGGSFATTQAALDAGQVVEACEVCHRAGAIADVSRVHGLQ